MKLKDYFKSVALLVLRICAKAQIAKTKPIVIGVGGSSGKSSVTSLIHLILRERYKVRYESGKNSETGIPLSILRLSMENYGLLQWIKVMIESPLRALFDFKKFDFYLAEMGIDGPLEPKNMSYLLKIITPDVGIITNISFEHSENFDSIVKSDKNRDKEILDATAAQELLLLYSISKSGKAIVNEDDQTIKENIHNIKANKIIVSSEDKNANFYIESTKFDLNSFSLSFIHNAQKFNLILNKPLPIHYSYSLIFAIAVCEAVGIKVGESLLALKKNFTLPPGRMNVFKGINNSTIIDSSYNNATIPPVLDLLDFLKEVGKNIRKVAIIGDMRELGTMSKKNHDILANKILLCADFAILIGPMTRKYVAPALEKKNLPFKSFTSFNESKDYILESIQTNDLILVKGSQNTLYLERVVEMLLKDKNDRKYLCRRGEYWDKQRQKSQ